MPRDKTAIKTAKPSPRSGYSLPLGAHPGNTGGKKGRSGRRPDSLKAFLAALRSDPNKLAALDRAASDETSRNFAHVWALAAKYDCENPGEKNRTELTGSDGNQLPIVVQIVREGKRAPRSG